MTGVQTCALPICFPVTIECQGTQGIQGTQGLQGIDGAYAAQGIQGTTGSQGLTGGGWDGLAGSSYKTANYQVTPTDLNNIIEASGTLTIYLPNTVSEGYATTIVAVGGATPAITINASSGTLYTTDASVVLRDRYAAATAFHKGSGTWYCWGNLK